MIIIQNYKQHNKDIIRYISIANLQMKLWTWQISKFHQQTLYSAVVTSCDSTLRSWLVTENCLKVFTDMPAFAVVDYQVCYD